MLRKITVRFESDRLGIAPLLADFARNVGWSVSVTRTGKGPRTQTLVAMVQSFDSEETCEAAMALLDDALRDLSPTVSVVR